MGDGAASRQDRGDGGRRYGLDFDLEEPLWDNYQRRYVGAVPCPESEEVYGNFICTMIASLVLSAGGALLRGTLRAQTCVPHVVSLRTNGRTGVYGASRGENRRQGRHAVRDESR